MVPARVTKLRACLKLCIGMMPGTIGMVDAAGADPVEIAKVEVVVEEHLGDGAGGAGIDLGLQHVDVGLEVAAFRMLLRIGGDRDLDVADAAA